MKINTIIWDWNGTLLNDTTLCLSIINSLLLKRGLLTLSQKKYKEIFTFPVKDYYLEAGFDFSKEDFETPANEFIEQYNRQLPSAELHQNVEYILNYTKEKYSKQIIISAMKQDALDQSVRRHKIDHYFDYISGINNHFANGKIQNAMRIFDKLSLNPNYCLIIGDTIHDYEVSKTLGCQCILVADGHQSIERLKACGCEVVGNLNELLGVI